MSIFDEGMVSRSVPEIDMSDSLMECLIPRLADVPGVAAIVLGGSRARGTATSDSDYDLGLYYGPGVRLDTDRLLKVVKGLVDDPDAAGPPSAAGGRGSSEPVG